MKVLHTSDWHLGQLFYQHTREKEHQAFLTWLTNTLLAEHIDLLLVAGDIYHTATPPASAENQLYQFIKTTKQHCPDLHIVIIAGNHDSANRIMAAKPLLAQFDTHVVGRFDANHPENVVLSITTNKGPATVVAMPFLRTSDIQLITNTDNTSSYNVKIAEAYQRALDIATQQHQADSPLIVMGHLHAKGGDISTDSERNLVIGGEDAISANVFGKQADYVALGHLHKAQKVAKSEHIRYCGTPLPMSFSERNYQHQVLIAEFSQQVDGTLNCAVKPLYIPRPAPILMLPEGDCVPLAQLCEQLSALQLPTTELAPYLRVKLHASETDTTFREQIENALEAKAVRFCGIERVRQTNNESNNNAVFEDLSQVEMLNPHTLLAQAFAANKDMAGTVMPEQLTSLLNNVIAELEEQEQQ
ncbi:exonuclease SbcCD subunit D C-terminal domain-containing protein [Pseudoalteromonas mariniglutinosa]|uniref:exonuclease SbcCD subunit D C-terminal domain-containing protein n=1 Tax=Pseudoalteromonas mariniglutinosa TaxID=206042 RepID=UPI00384DFCCC